MSDDPTSATNLPQNNAPPVTTEFERRLAVFVGPRWERSYRKKLRPFLEDASFVPTWNWSAGLASPFWFLYRKMYLWFMLFFFAPQLLLTWLVPSVSELKPDELLLPANQQAMLMMLGLQFSVHLAAGGVANWLLFRRASTAIRVVGLQSMPADDAMQLLRRVGGVSRGLTLGIVALFVVLAMASAMGTALPA